MGKNSTRCNLEGFHSVLARKKFWAELIFVLCLLCTIFQRKVLRPLLRMVFSLLSILKLLTTSTFNRMLNQCQKMRSEREASLEQKNTQCAVLTQQFQTLATSSVWLTRPSDAGLFPRVFLEQRWKNDKKTWGKRVLQPRFPLKKSYFHMRLWKQVKINRGLQVIIPNWPLVNSLRLDKLNRGFPLLKRNTKHSGL